MLAAIRAFAKSWVASLLIGLLVISFSVWGIRDVLHPKFSDAVISAGSHETSPAQFKREFEIIRQQYVQQTGQDLTAQDVVSQGLDQRALSDVEGQQALAEYLQRLGLRPSDHLVDVEFNQAPMFLNQLGVFDQTVFDNWLRQEGLSAQQLKGEARDEIAQLQLVKGMAAGLQAPKIYGAVVASYGLEGRDISYFVLDPHSVPPPAAPTDAQLQALINQHASELTRPEMRTLSVVRFSAKTLAPSMPVDEMKVQSLYQARKDSLAQPEKRSLVEFPTRDSAKAATIAAKLKAGQDPDAIAKALGVQPVAYNDQPRASVVDPAVADAAFQATVGQVVGPITSGLAGYAVIKLTKVTPASTPTLDQLRPQLEADVKTDAAIQVVFDAVKKYSDAHDSGANLADAARAAGATPVEVGPVTAQGRDLTNQPTPGVSERLLKEAFSLPQGAESELEDEGGGEYFALRVEKVAAPALPTLAEIKPQITQYYMQQAVDTALSARAKALVQAVGKGQTMQAAAASANAKLQTTPNITRQALQQGRRINSDMIEALFGAKLGGVVDGQVGQVQFMVVHIDAVHPAPGAAAAEEAVIGSKSFDQSIFNDMVEAAQTLARAVVKPQGDLAAARAALNISPEDLPKSGAKPKPGIAP
jgi:peptidyl-prolyl cis-trans isomerase D